MTIGNGDLALSIFDDLPDAMILVDGDANIALANRQAEMMFGYGRKELVGHPLDILIPERFAGRHRAHVAQFFAHPATRAMGSNLVLVARCKGGTEISVDIRLSPMSILNETFSVAAIRLKSRSENIIESIASAASHKIIAERVK